MREGKEQERSPENGDDETKFGMWIVKFLYLFFSCSSLPINFLFIFLKLIPKLLFRSALSIILLALWMGSVWWWNKFLLPSPYEWKSFFEGCWFLDGSFPFSEKQQGIRFSVGNIQRLLMLTRWTNTRNTAVFMSHELHYGLFRQIRCLLIHHFQSRLMTVDFLTTLAVVSRS